MLTERHPHAHAHPAQRYPHSHRHGHRASHRNGVWQLQVAPVVQAAPVPSTQLRPVQQSAFWAHTCPTCAQTVVAGWQLPTISAIWQTSPRQQSALAVHEPLWGWQDGGGLQAPERQ